MASTDKPLKLLFTAEPGTGKSTAIKNIVQKLQTSEHDIVLSGFYTEEVLDKNGERLGFDLVDVNDVDGSRRAPLSRICFASQAMVENFGVDLNALVDFIPLVDGQADVVVIDEIGNMQLYSDDFADLVERTVSGAATMLGSVHVFRHPFTDALKERVDVNLQILELSRTNRDSLPTQAAEDILLSAMRTRAARPTFAIVAHGSAAYQETIDLRHSILREPLGLRFLPEELAAEKDSIHITCHIKGQLVGCLVLKPHGNGELQMRQVAVNNMLQGQGIGKALVKYSEEYVLSTMPPPGDITGNKNGKKIWLHARETAVPFYERLGYEREGEAFEEVGLPHWSMYKVL